MDKLIASDKIIAKTHSKAQNYCYKRSTLLMEHIAGKCALNKIIATDIIQTIKMHRKLLLVTKLLQTLVARHKIIDTNGIHRSWHEKSTLNKIIATDKIIARNIIQAQ